MNKLLSFFDIKLWKFLLVGVLNTIVGNGLQFLLYNLTSLRNCGQAGTWTASIISYIVGAVMSYFLNKYFTFKNTEKGWRPVMRFAISQAACFTIAYAIAIPLVSHICISNGWTWHSLEGLFGQASETKVIADATSDIISNVPNNDAVMHFASNVSMIFGSCLFVLLNYIAQRFYAFKEKKD